jgi:hypothetical protein
MGETGQKKSIATRYPLIMATLDRLLCIEKERLIRAYTTAAVAYNHLNSVRVDALIRGDDPPPLDKISEAEVSKENAKYAILVHLEEHGC